MVRLAIAGDATIVDQITSIQNRIVNGQIVATTDSLGSLPSANEFDAVVTNEVTIDEVASAQKHVLALFPNFASFSESASAFVMVGFQARFDPAMQAVRESIESGQVGEPGLLRIHRWQSAPPTDLVARISREIDLANWMFSRRPDSVYAIRRNDAKIIQIHLGFGEGMAVIDYTTLPAGQNDYDSLSVIGSTGAAYSDDHHNMQLLYRGDRPAAIKTTTGHTAQLAMIQEFVDAIQQQRAPTVTIADAIAATQVTTAIQTSLETGDVVKTEASE